MSSDVPAGFEKLFRFSEYTELIGPFYTKQSPQGMIVGLRFDTKHSNARGKAHGGMISTLADIAMGYTLAFSEDPPKPFVTVNMNVDFMGHIEIGEWVEVHVTVDKKGKSIAFARCEFVTRDQVVARATGVFKDTRGGFDNGQFSGETK